MRLHLVRHGHTDALGRTLTGRSPGIGLNQAGRDAAQGAAHAMDGCRVDALLCSPQPRARQTAEAFGVVLGQLPQIDPSLDEVDFGVWAGQDFRALDTQPAWQSWNRLRSLACGGGETMLAVQARVVGLVQRLRYVLPDGELVLVSHADVLRALLAHVLGMPIDLMQRLDLSPAGRSIVTWSGEEVRVEAVNLPPARP